MSESIRHPLTLPVYPSVKPDPPEEVRLSPLPKQQLGVQWGPPKSWPFPEIFSLKYWIRYRRQGTSRFRQVRKTRGGRGWSQLPRTARGSWWGSSPELQVAGGPHKDGPVTSLP